MNIPIEAIQLGLPLQVKARLNDMGIDVTAVECTAFQDEMGLYGKLHIRVVLTRVPSWRSYCWDRSITKLELVASRDISDINRILSEMAAEAADEFSIAMVQDIMLRK